MVMVCQGRHKAISTCDASLRGINFFDCAAGRETTDLQTNFPRIGNTKWLMYADGADHEKSV
jgi:hypothetical protein